MSKKAVDAEGREHFADDFHDPYCGQYFCPNPECHTQLILKNLGLEQKAYNTRRPYFSATRNYPHVEGCPFSNTCISDENLKDVGFQPDDFFHSLQKKTDSVRSSDKTIETKKVSHKENKLTTLNKLYVYCMQNSDDHILPDGTKVFEIFQDDRNKKINDSVRHPCRMIKLQFRNCNFAQFDEEKKCYKIWCMFPHTETTKPPGRYFTLGFTVDNIPLMKEICEKLTPLKKRYGKVYILVGGEWNHSHCYLTSKKQLYILGPDK